MQNIQPGLTGERAAAVTQSLTAQAMGSGDLPVYATPAMIALMEAAAVAAIQPYLEPGQSSVGVELQVRHIAASPLGQTVRARAEVTGVEGRQVMFKIQAWDAHELIGEGTHTRFLIDAARFMGRAAGKSSAP